eukprot:gene26767-4344_t
MFHFGGGKLANSQSDEGVTRRRRLRRGRLSAPLPAPSSSLGGLSEFESGLPTGDLRPTPVERRTAYRKRSMSPESSVRHAMHAMLSLVLSALLAMQQTIALTTYTGRLHRFVIEDGEEWEHSPFLLKTSEFGFIELNLTANQYGLAEEAIAEEVRKQEDSVGGATPSPQNATEKSPEAETHLLSARRQKYRTPTTCSFGKVQFDEKNNPIVGPLVIPCSGTSPTGYKYRSDRCSWEDQQGWLEMAQQQARKLGFRLEDYRHEIMIIPDSEYVPCYWAGTSDQGCGGLEPVITAVELAVSASSTASCVSLIHSWAASSLSVLTHELGHSMYLAHSALNGSEYKDITSAMGSQCCKPVCYNAPETWTLGWTAPSEVFDAATALAGQWYTVQVPEFVTSCYNFIQADAATALAGQWYAVQVPEFVTSRYNFIQIFPTWTGSQLPAIYLSYKMDGGYNAGINPNGKRYGGKLHIHTHAAMNNSGTYDISRSTDLVAMLLPGEQFRISCPGTCGYTLVQSNTWCASSRGTWGRTSVDDCANYCKTVAGSTPPFCFDFNDKINHCECSSGPDPSQAADNYNSYTYSCASDTTKFDSVCILEGSNCVLCYNCAAGVASDSVLPIANCSYCGDSGTGSLFLCDKPKPQGRDEVEWVSSTNKGMLSLCLALILASGTCPSYVNAQGGDTSTVPEFQEPMEVVLPPERIYTAANAPSGSEPDIELTGRFVSTSAHNTLDYSLLLSDGSGTVVLLPQRPLYPLTDGSKEEGAPVGLGDLIDLPCAFLTPTTSGADVLYCSGMGLAVFVEGPSKAPTKSAATGETTTNYDIKMLVVVHTASSCSGVQQSLSLAAMRAMYVKVSDQVNTCSYGSMRMPQANLNVIGIAFNDCTAYSKCSYQALASSSWTAAKAQLGGSPQNTYTHWSIILPSGTACDSQWSALAYVGMGYDASLGRPATTWYTPSWYGAQRVATIMQIVLVLSCGYGASAFWGSDASQNGRLSATQEILHNFGLFHSSKDTTTDDICTCHTDSSVSCGTCHSEYGDYSSCMGRGDVCPNAVEAYRAQWANAIATLTSSNMAVGQVFSYSIPPLDSSSNSLIIVRPSWASVYKFNLYFSTRRSSRGDAGISSTFINTISVHSIDKNIDPKGSNENGNIHILRTVSANTRQVFFAQKVVLQVGAVAPDQSIGITLCRYSSSDSDNPVAKSPPPPSPSPPLAPKSSPPPAEDIITTFLRKSLTTATILSATSASTAPEVVLTNTNCFMGGASVNRKSPGTACAMFRGSTAGALGYSASTAYWIAATYVAQPKRWYMVKVTVQMKGDAVVAYASAAKYYRTATTIVNEFSMNDFWTKGVTMAIAESYAASGAGVASLSYTDTLMIEVNNFLGDTPAAAEPMYALNVVSAYQVELQDQGCVMGGKSVSKSQPGQACRVFRSLAPWDLDSNDTVANWLAVAKYGSSFFISNIVVQLVDGQAMAYVLESKSGKSGVALNAFTAESVHFSFRRTTKPLPVALAWNEPGAGVAKVTYTQATVVPTTDFLPITLATAHTLYGLGSSTQITMVDDQCFMAGTYVNRVAPGMPCRVFLGTQTSGGPHWIAAYHKVATKQVVMVRIDTPVVNGFVKAYISAAGWMPDAGATQATFDAATINSMFSVRKGLTLAVAYNANYVSMPSVAYQVTSTDPPPCAASAADFSQMCSSVLVGTDFACSSPSLSLLGVNSSDECSSKCSSQENTVAPFCFSYNEQSGACQCSGGPATAIISAGSTMFFQVC